MRFMRIGTGFVSILCALGVVVFLVTAGAIQPPAEPPSLHSLFMPDDAEVEAAVSLGEKARKRRETLDELLRRWSKPVPDADGYVIPLVPSALVAAAAYDAAKLHKDSATQQKQVETACQRGQEFLTFRVVLRSKGSGIWLFPQGMKPGDKKALESIQFVLADDQERFFQPLDPEAQKRISAQNKSFGLPYSVGAYVPIGRWYFSVPIPLGGRRQDFEARYEPTFALKDAKGNPVITKKNEVFSLRIIGNRGEKSVEFTLADLTAQSKQAKAGVS